MTDNGRFMCRESQKPQIIKAKMKWLKDTSPGKLSDLMAGTELRNGLSDTSKASKADS